MKENQKHDRIKQLKVVIQPYYKRELTDEETNEASANLVKFFNILMEWDIKHKKELLIDSEVFCNDCNNQIQEISDFHIYNDKNYCSACFQNYSEELKSG